MVLESAMIGKSRDVVTVVKVRKTDERHGLLGGLQRGEAAMCLDRR